MKKVSLYFLMAISIAHLIVYQMRGIDDGNPIQRARQEEKVVCYVPVKIHTPLKLPAQRNSDLKIHIPSSVSYNEEAYRKFRIGNQTTAREKQKYQLTANLKPYSRAGNIGNQMFIFLIFSGGIKNVSKFRSNTLTSGNYLGPHEVPAEFGRNFGTRGTARSRNA